MQSSSGKYFVGLDHIRAVAAFMVFSWHFIHVEDGHLASPSIFPLSLLTEGHTGVALFMVLSGYLFAKLLDGKKIVYLQFLWNRFLRLGPLLILVIIIVGLLKYYEGQDLTAYSKIILAGAVIPSLPNGGWSITAEVHFYIILPALLMLTSKWKYSLLFVLVGVITIRFLIYQQLGQIQTFSFWTILGRIDQFLLGILVFQFRDHIAHKHGLVLFSVVTFMIFYWHFDSIGGFYGKSSYPSPNPIWIIMPTLEGLVYGVVICWYDNSVKHSTNIFSRFLALIGTYSYSIYLFHFFIVFQISSAINTHVADLSNIHVALAFSLLSFFVMVPIGYLSYKFIESPFLQFRTKYILIDDVAE